MKKIQKIIVILIIFLCIICVSASVSADAFTDEFKKIYTNPTAGNGELVNLGGIIIGVIQIVSAGIAVIMVIVLGIRYMLTSPNEKAGIKKQMMPFIIGAILTFGATSFIKLIQYFVNDIF